MTYMRVRRRISELEYQWISCLRESLHQNGIPESYYGILEYREEAICLNKAIDQTWSVYEAERGNNYNTRKYRDLYSACLDLIDRVSDSVSQRESIIKDFKRTSASLTNPAVVLDSLRL
ncbi:MAG: hypothetical protein LUF30_12845 [Lachnospiraceae bacterium]|nr:hypothetical protein [Lachnospiraceae bacterium]